MERIKSAQKSSKKSRILKILFLLTLMLAIVIAVLYFFFRIQSIQIVNNNLDSASTFVDAKKMVEDKYLGKNIIFVDEKDISSYLTSFVNTYKLSSVEKIYPGSIKIVLDERLPKYKVKAPNGTFTVDSDNYVIGQTDDSNHDLEYQASMNTARFITDPKLLAGLKYAELEADVVVGGNISITFDDGSIVYLPENQNPDEILEILKKIRQKYTIENRIIESVDLRYAKPVIKFK